MSCQRGNSAAASASSAGAGPISSSADLPDYLQHQAPYPEPLQPTAQEVADNSCVTPAPS
ncbi:MAG TPA: hypothetical protein VH478_08925 [Trebonia sp.]|nr:hypothetical protein [Trebonia sp.]